MRQYHPHNRNLTLHTDSTWHGYPLLARETPYINEYLANIACVIDDAVDEHPRTIAIRCDLRFPEHHHPDIHSNAVSRFTASLKNQLEAADKAKRSAGKRVHPCTLRYIWIREWSTARLWHYHVVLFLNKDRFFTLGRFKHLMDDNTNLSDRIQKAWASALKIPMDEVIGLVHFPENPLYVLDRNSPDFQYQYADLFKRLSYFAKDDTKHYGDGRNNFGSSRRNQRL